MATWYIVENDQQQGPYSDEQFADIVAQGRVGADTLVWNETMTEWQRYADVQAARLETEAHRLASANDEQPDALTPLLRQRQGEAVEAAAERPVCAECGQTFPAEELVPISGRWICAGCKPLALQKVREGIMGPEQMRYAGFWIRGAAKFIDGLVMFAVNMIVNLIVTGVIQGLAALLGAQGGVASIVAAGIGWLLQMALSAAYTTFFLGRFGATPGKMACSIKVVRSDGTPLTYWRAFGRHFADILSGIFTLFIGYLIAAFDAEKRALHDHICDTRVVYK